MITIRKATFDDVAAMLPMTVELYASLQLKRLAPYDAEYIEQYLATSSYDEDKLAIVADDGERIIGMLIAHTLPHWFSPQHRYAQEMMFWVVPESRHNGAGTMLIKEFEAWTSERNLRIAALSSSGVYQRKRLTKLYGRRGYVEESVIFMRRV